MKITPFDRDVENISKLDDRPNIENGYTSKELKSVFDRAGRDIKEYINRVLIEELASSTSASSGADKIGSGDIPLLPSGSVQEKLEALSERITDLANGTIPDGSITPDKFSDDIKSFLEGGSIRFFSKMNKGEGTFEVLRGGTYKVTLQGAGSGGGLLYSGMPKKQAGSSGAYLVAWLDLEIGDILTFTVGGGGKGLITDNNAKVSDATDGEDSVLFKNGEEIARADGGRLGSEEKARATGGDVRIDGTHGSVGGFFEKNTDYFSVEFSIGADSPLGRGAAFRGDFAGNGAGGFAGDWVDYGYFRDGGDGGDGCILIEYIA